MPDGVELLWFSAYCNVTLVAWGRSFACISGQWVLATLTHQGWFTVEASYEQDRCDNFWIGKWAKYKHWLQIGIWKKP